MKMKIILSVALCAASVVVFAEYSNTGKTVAGKTPALTAETPAETDAQTAVVQKKAAPSGGLYFTKTAGSSSRTSSGMTPRVFSGQRGTSVKTAGQAPSSSQTQDSSKVTTPNAAVPAAPSVITSDAGADSGGGSASGDTSDGGNPAAAAGTGIEKWSMDKWFAALGQIRDAIKACPRFTKCQLPVFCTTDKSKCMPLSYYDFNVKNDSNICPGYFGVTGPDGMKYLISPDRDDMSAVIFEMSKDSQCRDFLSIAVYGNGSNLIRFTAAAKTSELDSNAIYNKNSAANKAMSALGVKCNLGDDPNFRSCGTPL